MNVLITGSILPQNTADVPCLKNHLSAVSKSFLCTKIYFPYFSNIHRPPLRPIKNKITEPVRFETVATITTPQKLNFPPTTRNPEKGITTSEGIGIAVLSRTDKIKIPTYPVELTTPSAQLLIFEIISSIFK